MFDEMIAPYFKARITHTKKLAKCPYWHHTCGSVYRLLDSIIGCGVDILHKSGTYQFIRQYADRDFPHLDEIQKKRFFQLMNWS